MTILLFPLDRISDDPSLLNISNNRSFLYGDGFFESMRYHRGKIRFFNDHYERMLRAFSILKFKDTLPAQDAFYKLIASQITEPENDARIRITFFRAGAGNYTPDISGTAALLQIQKWPDNEYSLNKEPVSFDIYKGHYKTCQDISAIKSVNCFVYTMAGIFAKENGLDDALIINERGNICEGGFSNLFIVKDNTIITPPVTDGCVDGVMRKQLLRYANEAGYKVSEESLLESDILNADEVFFTTGSRGLMTGGKFRDKKFGSNVVHKLLKKLQEDTAS